ncbi:MAG TPA: hypothetical protein VMT32_16260 [Bryobacteraceae bacterium]|nr:hypothetical protein [Bryobacteraceae bacterium]
MKLSSKATGCIAFAAFLALVTPITMQAQNIGWEGETGVFVTPLAYTVDSPAKGLGRPYVGFHYLGAGKIIGDFYETSLTMGAFGRTEFGYTRNFLSQASDPNLSHLWSDGFNIAFGKVNIIPENWGKHDWIPAFSVGGMGRWGIENVGGALVHKKTNNGDVYGVGSKTILPKSKLPVILSGGVRGTNAQLWGMGGNAPDWKARAFGSAAFVVKLPNKATMVFASEVAQQPKHPEGFPNLIIPTTLTYAVRLLPAPEHKLAVDFGVAQIAGHVQPGVNLKARAQLGVQVTYGF